MAQSFSVMSQMELSASPDSQDPLHFRRVRTIACQNQRVKKHSFAKSQENNDLTLQVDGRERIFEEITKFDNYYEAYEVATTQNKVNSYVCYFE